jgi:hypothetical protein
MSDNPAATDAVADDTTPHADRRWRINEDWAATIVGLVIVLVVLIGLVPKGLVP